VIAVKDQLSSVDHCRSIGPHNGVTGHAKEKSPDPNGGTDHGETDKRADIITRYRRLFAAAAQLQKVVSRPS